MIVKPITSFLAFLWFLLGAGLPSRAARGLGLSRRWLGAAAAAPDFFFAAIFLSCRLSPSLYHGVDDAFLESFVSFEVLLIAGMPPLAIVALLARGRKIFALAGGIVAGVCMILAWDMSQKLGEAWPLAIFAVLACSKLFVIAIDPAQSREEVSDRILARWLVSLIIFPLVRIGAVVLGESRLATPSLHVDRIFGVGLEFDSLIAFGFAYFGLLALFEFLTEGRQPSPASLADSRLRRVLLGGGYVSSLLFLAGCLAFSVAHSGKAWGTLERLALWEMIVISALLFPFAVIRAADRFPGRSENVK